MSVDPDTSKTYRLSSWTVREEISPSEEIWLHGYTGAVDVLEKAIIEKKPAKIKSQMIQRGYLTDLNIHEEQKHFQALCEKIRNIELKTMSYVLQLSMDCNFACAYCFEHKSKKIPNYKKPRITPEYMQSIRKVIESVRERKSIDSEELILFGGEPILPKNSDTINEAIKLFDDLKIESLTVITNGYHIGDMINSFRSTNAKFQITLDGTQDIHDARRFDVKTKKSFKKIMINVLYLLKNNFKVELRINVDHKNYQNIPDLFSYFADHDLEKNENFYPYIAYIFDYGKYKQEISPVEIYQYFCSQKEFKNFDVGLDPLGLEKKLKESILFDKPFEFTIDYCGANKGTMITFSPDGLMHPCWDFDSNDEPIGTYHPMIKWNMQNYQKNWIDRKIFNIPECKSCKYALFCGGGCQYLANLKKGSYFLPYCNNFQTTFNAILKNIGSSTLQ